MGKIIQIEVPDEIGEAIEKDPKLKEVISQKIIDEVIYRKMKSGSIPKNLLNAVVGVGDVELVNEQNVLRELREKAKGRLG